MANGDTIVSICNIGMIALGEDPITSVFPADPTKRATLCSLRYDDTRRAVLRAAPWDCAKKYIQLAASTTIPPFGYNNAFPVPADYLRGLPLQDSDGNQIDDDYERVGQALYTDATSPINLPYIFDLQDPTQFDPLLVHAIAYALAAELAVPLRQSTSERDDMLKLLENKLSIARLISGQEKSIREWDADVMLRSRR